MSDAQSKSTLSIVAVIAALVALAISLGSAVLGQRKPVLQADAGQGASINTASIADSQTNTDANPDLAKQARSLQALTEELRQEQASRLQLQRQVDALEDELTTATEQVELLEQRLDQAEQGTGAVGPETQGISTDVNSIADSEEVREAHRRAFGNVGGFGRTRSREERISSLQSAGVDVVQASELVQRIDQNQLAELELRDEAARGGWQDSDEFAQRLEELEAEAPDLREELGDDAYDRYLFASGSNNRVVIGSVIDGSAASVSGFEVGDTVLSYAGQRLFNIRELQNATRAGVRGESVQVTLQRDGTTLDLSVTRGPLGVTLTRDQQNPDS